jgi:hypothetical protein
MIDWTITAGNVLTIITLAVGALAAFFSLRGRLDLTQTKAREAFDIAKLARDELQRFQIDVTKHYIRSEALEKIEAAAIVRETRILTTLEALGERIDRLVDRMDRGPMPRRRSNSSQT